MGLDRKQRERLAEILDQAGAKLVAEAALCQGCQRVLTFAEALSGTACTDARCPCALVQWERAEAAYCLNMRVIAVADADGGVGMLVKSGKPWNCRPVRCTALAGCA